MIWKDTLFTHILNLPFCTFEHFWPLDSAYKSCIIKIIINNNSNNKNNSKTKQNKTKRYVTKPYRLKRSCNIPSTLLQGFRNYIATILTKLPRRYSVLYQRIGFTVCCSYVSFVCMLCFYPVALCIVVFCCFPLLAADDILSASAYFWAYFYFQREALFLHLYVRCCPHFGKVCSSCCIKALSLFFCIEASSSYFILRLRPRIILRLNLPSYFILRLRPRMLFWGFVLIFHIEASSSYLIWGFVLIVIYWGYVPQFESLVLIVVGPSCFVCTACLVCLQWYVCGSVCLYFCLG